MGAAYRGFNYFDCPWAALLSAFEQNTGVSFFTDQLIAIIEQKVRRASLSGAIQECTNP
jgi:hypothetical protein